MLFSISLASKLAMKGLVSVSLHPGAIPTNLFGPMGENGVATLSEDYLKELSIKKSGMLTVLGSGNGSCPGT